MGKKQKNKEKIIVKCIGNSGNGVTGSCFLIEYSKKNGEVGKFLIEMGMQQLNGRLLEEYKANKAIIDAVPYKEIEFVLIGHSHGDHILNIPGLYHKGFDGKILTTEGNKEISRCILKDGAYILNRNTQSLHKKGNKCETLYNEQDVDMAIYNTETYSLNEIHKINDYVSVRFRNNSHVIFATQIEIFITLPSGKVKKILYTSDLGSNKNFKHRYFLRETDIIPKSNLAIFEATYSDTNRGFPKEEVEEERNDMIKAIKRQLKNKNKVIIPSFAFSRSQDLLCFLYDRLKDSKVMEDSKIVIDGKLVHEINNVYLKQLKGEERNYFQEVLNWDKIHFVKDYTESLNMAHSKDKGMIVISGSGMGNIGRILNYFKASLGKKRDMIMFIGYTSKNLIGDYIKNTDIRKVKIEGIEYDKLVQVKTYKTWSSHIQSDEILKYLKQHNTDRVLIHHSDDNKYQFAEKAKEELYKIGKTTRISVIDKNNSEFIIN
jgi:metallo-beta-lactamase family protein